MRYLELAYLQRKCITSSSYMQWNIIKIRNEKLTNSRLNDIVLEQAASTLYVLITAKYVIVVDAALRIAEKG